MPGPEQEEPEELSGNVIDLDLDKEDALLREAVGKSTFLRMHGTVIEVMHPSLWTTAAMDAISDARWHVWAREVIEDDEQYDVFVDANLRNYQMEAIYERCGKDAGKDLGKSKKSGPSSRSTRKR
jgi:hypothetical protein